VQNTLLFFAIEEGLVKIPGEPLTGPGDAALGKPPRDTQKDWAAVVRRKIMSGLWIAA